MVTALNWRKQTLTKGEHATQKGDQLTRGPEVLTSQLERVVSFVVHCAECVSTHVGRAKQHLLCRVLDVGFLTVSVKLMQFKGGELLLQFFTIVVCVCVYHFTRLACISHTN